MFVEDMKNGEGKYLFYGGGEKKEKEKGEIIWTSKMNGDANQQVNIVQSAF